MQPEAPVEQLEVQDARAAQFLGMLRETIGAKNFQHWFENRARCEFSGNQFRLSVGSSFLQSWMQRRFGLEVTRIAKSIDEAVEVVWCVDQNLAGSDDDTTSDAGAVSQSVEDSQTEHSHSSPTLSRVPRLTETGVSRSGADRASNPARGKRRFARLTEFVAGAGNELALTAAQQLAQAPGERLNPLYLHGAVGTGKTHLAEGIYGEIRKQHPELQIAFMTAENFGNRFTQALRTQQLPGFRQRFRAVDVLVVDDVSFFDGKQAMQEEFLHTVNQLISHGRQLVVTADCHPRLLSKVSEELVTRFLCGMVCRIESADVETRRRIVRAKAEKLNASFAPEALDFVARRFVHNVRELEGALNTLDTWYCMTRRRVTLNAARQALSELERDCIRVVRLADIESAVCDLFGLSDTQLKSSARTRTVSQPRMLAMFLARRHTQAAYREIGEFFGGRNHSTVVAAEKKIDGWLRSDEEMSVGGRCWQLNDVIERLEQQLMAG